MKYRIVDEGPCIHGHVRNEQNKFVGYCVPFEVSPTKTIVNVYSYHQKVEAKVVVNNDLIVATRIDGVLTDMTMTEFLKKGFIMNNETKVWEHFDVLKFAPFHQD